MSRSVFISYSREDLAARIQLETWLQSQGVEVHVDERSIEPAAPLRPRIRELTESSDFVICLLSASSLRSPWVIWEIGDLVALAKGKLIPARLDDALSRRDLVDEVLQSCTDEQQALNEQIKRRLDAHDGADDLWVRKERFEDLRRGLPKVVAGVRGLNIVDLTPERFEAGLALIAQAITGRDLPPPNIPVVDSLDNTSFADQRRAVMDDIAAERLQLAATKSLDLLRQFFGDDHASVSKAIALSGQVRSLMARLRDEQRRPGGLSVDFLAYYQEQFHAYADELMGLIPPAPGGALGGPITTLIAEEAARLKQEIADEVVGFQSHLLAFVRDYSADPDIEHRAVRYSLQLATFSGLHRQAFRDGMANLVDTVVSTYSREDLGEAAAKRSQAELDAARGYLDLKTVALRCRGLRRRFGSAFDLGPIDLEIRRGDILGVVGENGNGKTTLFRLLVGDLAADGGELEYPSFAGGTGRRIDWVSVRSQIAYVPQEIPRWRGHLKEVLQYEAAIHGLRRADNDHEVAFIVERLGLAPHLHKRWDALSGGYKFRFALARALVWSPKLLVLDEPLANLDVNAQITVLRDIKGFATGARHPMAVLLSSQHLHEVEAISDRILFLSGGRPLFNDRRARLGEDRTENLFELGCPLPIQGLTRAIRGRLPARIAQDGMTYTLATGLDLGPEQVLKALLEAGVEVHYFRDISRSTKRLFRRLA